VHIDSIEVMASRLPLKMGAWEDQVHHVSEIELIVVDVRSGNERGTGISHTSGVGARSIVGLLGELAPQLVGRDVRPGALWDWSWRYLHDCGGGGVTTLALAAVDLATWDLAAKAAGVPVVDLIGRKRDRVPLYGSGINLNLSKEELVEQARYWQAQGYKAAKIKVGKPCVDEDVDRVASVREAVPDLPLMVDANQGWSLAEAARRIRSLERFSLVWVEEPLLIDDVIAHSQLVEKVHCAIALGENLYTLSQFKEFIARNLVDFVQADLARVGGITPYLRVAELAAAYQLPMAPHFIMELSVEVAATVRNLYLVEDTVGGTLRELGAIRGESAVADGYYTVGARPGLGVEWDRALLKRQSIAGLEASYG